jgi:rod shape-determining protein MreC
VPGVPVGTVTSVTTQPGSLTPTAVVKPFADFTGLGVVGVVVSK